MRYIIQGIPQLARIGRLMWRVLSTRERSHYICRYNGNVASHAFNFRSGRAATACALVFHHIFFIVWCAIDVFVECSDAIALANVSPYRCVSPRLALILFKPGHYVRLPNSLVYAACAPRFCKKSLCINFAIHVSTQQVLAPRNEPHTI